MRSSRARLHRHRRRNALFARASRMRSEQKNARSPRVLCQSGVRRDYAACLCIAPLADAVPRIAFTERSIAAHSRPISAAARPSA